MQKRRCEAAIVVGCLKSSSAACNSQICVGATLLGQAWQDAKKFCGKYLLSLARIIDASGTDSYVRGMLSSRAHSVAALLGKMLPLVTELKSGRCDSKS